MILIKGLEMPQGENGLLCLDIYPDGRVFINLNADRGQVATAEQFGITEHKGEIMSECPYINKCDKGITPAGCMNHILDLIRHNDETSLTNSLNAKQGYYHKSDPALATYLARAQETIECLSQYIVGMREELRVEYYSMFKKGLMK